MKEKSDVAGTIIAALYATFPTNVSQGNYSAIIHQDGDWRDKIARVRFDNFPDVEIHKANGRLMQRFDARDPDFFGKITDYVSRVIKKERKSVPARTG